MRHGTSSLDKITAEALELAIYKEAIAVQFDKSLPPIRPRLCGADGRLAQLSSLITAIKSSMGNAGQKETVEARAKQLGHLLAVSKSKDATKDQPQEWVEAIALIGELANLGIVVEIEKLLPKQVRSRSLKRQKIKNKKKRRTRKEKKKRKPRLIYTAFETNPRRH